MKYRVTLIKGDGIGPEVTEATCRVLHAAGAPIEWEEAPGGAEAVERYGSPMPTETLDAVRRNRLGLKGPLMTPKGRGFRSANVTLRQKLDLYVGYRPVKTLPGIETPYTDVDLVVLRENTEDLYAGIEHEVTPGTILTLKCRLVLQASGLRDGHSKTCATPAVARSLLHQGQGCAHGRRRVPRRLRASGRRYPYIEKHCRWMRSRSSSQNPTPYDVLLLKNLYGDILSDLAAGLVGGLGVVQGANISDQIAVFEAVHGTAPGIAGKGLANPLAVLNSALLLLQYVGEHKIADRIERAIFDVLDQGKVRTGDLGGTANTDQFTDAIIDAL